MIDAAVALIIILAVYKGLRKGLIMALFSMVSIILGITLAIKFSAVTAGYLQKETAIQSKWLPILSFAIILIATLLAVHLGGKLLERVIDLAMLGWVNKILGAVFFTVYYSLVLSAALFYLEKIQLITTKNTASSVCYPYLKPIMPQMMETSGRILPFLKDAVSQLSDYFEDPLPEKKTLP